MIRSIKSAPFALCLLGACNPTAEAPPISQQEAVALANTYVTKEYPGSPKQTAPEAVDGGKSWVVAYPPPAGALGGTTYVVIDKRTKQVMADFGTQ